MGSTTKPKTQFVCQECGAISPKWQGQCRHCHQWNCVVEEAVLSSTGREFKKEGGDQKPITLDFNTQEWTTPRMSTGMAELDRVLGGGLVPGAYILLGGAPGIGKSTLLLQMAYGLSQSSQSDKNFTVFYVSAEESVSQTSLRAKRLFLKKNPSIFILNETSLEKIFHHVEQIKPKVLIIDSIQTVQFSEIPASPGTVSQVRESANQLMNFAKSTGTAVFIIGHITKEGGLAGPRLLEHTVDTVLSFDGDPHHNFRILRTLKNRFGATNEIGVFQMSSHGLEGVSNPSEFFLEERGKDLQGSVVFTAMEGSRPLLCEIQALVIRSYLSIPRRTAIGMDINRLNMITAVLDRYLQLGLSQCDVFLNVVGGLRITEPAADLAVAKALLSAQSGQAVDGRTVFFGEMGLTGEIRASTFCEERIKEAQKLGFKHIYLPAGNKKHQQKVYKSSQNLHFHWVASIKDLGDCSTVYPEHSKNG